MPEVMGFKKAERKQAKLRLAINSASGAGKTYSALLIAKGLGGRIAMIDTEHGSGSLYAATPGMPEYEVLELDAPFLPKRYIEAIHCAENAGFATIIIDSGTHAWAGEGGVLDMHDKATSASKSGNSYTSWREVTPEHNKLVDAILQSKCHVIMTMRTKQEYAQTTENGKTVVKKLGTAPIQREGMDYEFTVVLDLSQEHIATASKDRTGLFDGTHEKPSEKMGRDLLTWLNQGAVPKVTDKLPPELQKVWDVNNPRPNVAPVSVSNPPAPATPAPQQTSPLKGDPPELTPETWDTFPGAAPACLIDTTWLDEQLRKLPAWTPEAVLQVMIRRYDTAGRGRFKDCKGILQAVEKLDKTEAADFTKQIENAVKKAENK